MSNKKRKGIEPKKSDDEPCNFPIKGGKLCKNKKLTCRYHKNSQPQNIEKNTPKTKKNNDERREKGMNSSKKYLKKRFDQKKLDQIKKSEITVEPFGNIKDIYQNINQIIFIVINHSEKFLKNSGIFRNAKTKILYSKINFQLI